MTWKPIDNMLFVLEQNDTFARFHFDYAAKNPPDELFHYTSSAGLLAVMDSQYMFATERSFLNDPQEFRWGLSVFQDYLNSNRGSQYPADFVQQVHLALDEDDHPHLRLFVLSLSANPDLLSQWRAYAENGQGFAIGLDGGVLRDRSGFGEAVLRDINLDHMPKDFVFCYHLLPVLYEPSQQEDAIKGFLDAAYSFWGGMGNQYGPDPQQVFRMILWYRAKELLISFKNPGYREESEWRIVATVHNRSEKIQYRNGRFGITPYVRLNLSRRADLPKFKLPLTTLWIGPNSPSKKNGRGLEMLCESKDLSITLSYSNIEYRV